MKRLSKVRFRGGELALRESDEQGQSAYYTLNGMRLGSVKTLCEIVADLGTFNSEFEFLLLLNQRPAVYSIVCRGCGQSVLVVVEEGGGSCHICGFFIFDSVEDYPETLH